MPPLLVGLTLLFLGATTSQLGQWTIVGERRHDSVQLVVAQLVPRAQRELEEKLGLSIQGRGTIVLSGSVASFREATPGVDHRHTLGVAYPARSTIYLNCQAIETSPLENLAITLRHELSHVLVGQVLRRGYRPVPTWFDEGVAVWVAGKVPQYDPGDFDRAAAAGTLRPLAELADGFPLDPVGRGIAYEQSERFIRFLVDRRGEEAVRRILQGAAGGQEFDVAFRQGAGTDVAALERQWLASLRPRWPLVTWALSWLASTVSLFMGMSLLALLSFWIYWRRRRRKFAEWDAERIYTPREDNPWS